MEPLRNDRWRGEFTVGQPGICLYAVEAWIDRFKSWHWSNGIGIPSLHHSTTSSLQPP
jgi:hypothetical protein